MGSNNKRILQSCQEILWKFLKEIDSNSAIREELNLLFSNTQVVLVGPQSCGKSSLIAACTGIQNVVQTGAGTAAVTVFQTKLVPDGKEERALIHVQRSGNDHQNFEETKAREVPLIDVGGSLRNIFAPNGITTIQRDIRVLVEVEIQNPTFLRYVDTIGLASIFPMFQVNSADDVDQNQIRNIVDEMCKQEIKRSAESLICLVHRASDDWGHNGAMEFVKPFGNRTILVLTFLDEKLDDRKDFIRRLFQDPGNSVKKIIPGLEFAAIFAVVTRSNDEHGALSRQQIKANEERLIRDTSSFMYELHQISPKRVGLDSLEQYLIDHQVKRLCDNMHERIKRLKKSSREKGEELNQLTEKLDQKKIKNDFRDIFLGLLDDLKQRMTSSYPSNDDLLHKLEEIYEDCYQRMEDRSCKFLQADAASSFFNARSKYDEHERAKPRGLYFQDLFELKSLIDEMVEQLADELKKSIHIPEDCPQGLQRMIHETFDDVLNTSKESALSHINIVASSLLHESAPKWNTRRSQRDSVMEQCQQGYNDSTEIAVNGTSLESDPLNKELVTRIVNHLSNPDLSGLKNMFDTLMNRVRRNWDETSRIIKSPIEIARKIKNICEQAGLKLDKAENNSMRGLELLVEVYIFYLEVVLPEMQHLAFGIMRGYFKKFGTKVPLMIDNAVNKKGARPKSSYGTLIDRFEELLDGNLERILSDGKAEEIALRVKYEKDFKMINAALDICQQIEKVLDRFERL